MYPHLLPVSAGRCGAGGHQEVAISGQVDMLYNEQQTGPNVVYINFGLLTVQVHCNIGGITDHVKALFGYRATSYPPEQTQMLVCNVIFDKKLFRDTLRDVVFNGPSVKVYRDIDSRYALEAGRTRFVESKTAILELIHDQPDVANVYLDPESYTIPSSLSSAGIRAEPEAFFYPLMTEWLRNFDACLMHCGAVAAGNFAIILNGPPGSGKSTHVIRMVKKGLSFLADDLAIVHRHKTEGIRFFPFREVSNVHAGSFEAFPELEYLKNCPQRGDGKYCVDIHEHLNTKAVSISRPGAMIRLFPDQREWMRRCPEANFLDRIHTMAFFISRPIETEKHFHLLCDCLLASKQWEVSQGYLRNQLDRFIDHVTGELNK